MTNAPHSALYLTDARDLWWNDDYLALVAARTGLASARRVLDCGCGVGHWTRTIARLLSPPAQIIGVDRENAWIERASAPDARSPRPTIAPSFQRADVHALPFADATFDVVTCQTLLIHVKDPAAVVKEMVRVLRPGGRLLIAEPNNLAESVARLAVTPEFSLEDAVASFRLEATCEKGKHAAGLGYNSLGEGLVGVLDPTAVDDVRVWNNDRCAVFAPGEARATRLELHDARRLLDSGALGWSKDETLRYFLSGGGAEADFEALWNAARRSSIARLEALERGTLSQNEGGLFYLLSARKR